MATTSPDDIWTPDSGDDYALTTDLAAMADTIQDALNNKRSDQRYFAHAGKTNGFQSMINGAIATIGSFQVNEGGFQLADNSLILPVDGTYQITYRSYYSGDLGGTVSTTLQLSTDNGVTFPDLQQVIAYKEPTQDVSPVSTFIRAFSAGNRLRLYSSYARSIFGSTGYNGVYMEANRLY